MVGDICSLLIVLLPCNGHVYDYVNLTEPVHRA